MIRRNQVRRIEERVVRQEQEKLAQLAAYVNRMDRTVNRALDAMRWRDFEIARRSQSGGDHSHEMP